MIPAVVGKTAEVTSHCPISSTEIRLTVTPDEVTSLDPASAVISFLVPGTSPEGPTCARQLFFRGPEDAEEWLKEHPKIAILSVEDGYKMAREVIIEPLLQMV